MKHLVITLFFLSLICCIRAAFSRGRSDDGPPGVCHIKNLGLKIPNNKEFVQDCVQYSCSYPEYTIATCGVATIPGPDGKQCRAALDLSKPYPDCCIGSTCA